VSRCGLSRAGPSGRTAHSACLSVSFDFETAHRATHAITSEHNGATAPIPVETDDKGLWLWLLHFVCCRRDIR